MKVFLLKLELEQECYSEDNFYTKNSFLVFFVV